MPTHNGSLDELCQRLTDLGFTIVDCKDIQYGHQIKLSGGCLVNWYPSKGNLGFQGNANEKSQVEAAWNGDSSSAFPNKTVWKPQTAAPTERSTNVFVVHGHDSVAREQLELVLFKLGLKPFVLQNSHGGGMTIIENLERHMTPQGKNLTEFGIVLMTPDDMGYPKVKKPEEAQPRPRQNVVMEMGMLISALGRSKVAILIKGHLEQPSDAHGIVYINFNDHVKETVSKLAGRLREAGFDISSEQVADAGS